MKRLSALITSILLILGGLAAFSGPSSAADSKTGCRCVKTVTKATGPFLTKSGRSVDMRVHTFPRRDSGKYALPKGRWFVKVYKRGKGKIRTVTQISRGRPRTVATGKMWRGRWRAVINYKPGPYGPYAPSRTVKFFKVR